MSSPLPTLLVIPTGIGCSFGGFAGDAIPSARLLAAASGCLITHPNVMNGAALYWNDSRIQYVEGYGLDRFAIGELTLCPVRQQKVGLLLDAGIEQHLRQRHLQVADGCRASLGLDIGPVVTTTMPLEITLKKGSSGTSWGEIGQINALLEAGEKLKEAGATAIAVVTRFPDDSESESLVDYRHGGGVDAVAGAEAVISHFLGKHLCLPCAHAPALTPLPLAETLDPRAVGEELGHTFLTCVLVGLSRAPDLVPVTQEGLAKKSHFCGSLHVDQLGAVVATEGALGGQAILACLERNIPLIVVSNQNILNVTSDALGIDDFASSNKKMRVYYARNYIEAAGLILLLREGITVDSLTRPIARVPNLS